jgi:hypothetical protein
MLAAQVAIVSGRAAAAHGFRTSEWIANIPPLHSHDADETVKQHHADNPTPAPASLSQQQYFAVPDTEESRPHSDSSYGPPPRYIAAGLAILSIGQLERCDHLAWKPPWLIRDDSQGSHARK